MRATRRRYYTPDQIATALAGLRALDVERARLHAEALECADEDLRRGSPYPPHAHLAVLWSPDRGRVVYRTLPQFEADYPPPPLSDDAA